MKKPPAVVRAGTSPQLVPKEPGWTGFVLRCCPASGPLRGPANEELVAADIPLETPQVPGVNLRVGLPVGAERAALASRKGIVSAPRGRAPGALPLGPAARDSGRGAPAAPPRPRRPGGGPAVLLEPAAEASGAFSPLGLTSTSPSELLAGFWREVCVCVCSFFPLVVHT